MPDEISFLDKKNLNLGSPKRKINAEALRKENSKIWYSKKRDFGDKKLVHRLKGENNTRFYHNLANGRKARNLISYYPSMVFDRQSKSHGNGLGQFYKSL